jgi:ABC-type transport system involved in multi-copper enzyme maturation permease subunit
MNALIQKEVRLLLPVWVAAMLLAAFPVWFCQPGDPAPLFAVFFGMSILAVASFGREFTSGTFALLLAQPVPRQKLWLAKFSVLLCALSLVCLTYLLSNLQNLDGFAAIPGAAALSVPVAIAGGFCSILLVRQTIPALALRRARASCHRIARSVYP